MICEHIEKEYTKTGAYCAESNLIRPICYEIIVGPYYEDGRGVNFKNLFCWECGHLFWWNEENEEEHWEKVDVFNLINYEQR